MWFYRQVGEVPPKQHTQFRRAVRTVAGLTSFGTCSVLEPVEDLDVLGLLPCWEGIPA
jgi:hypothetical protein